MQRLLDSFLRACIMAPCLFILIACSSHLRAQDCSLILNNSGSEMIGQPPIGDPKAYSCSATVNVKKGRRFVVLFEDDWYEGSQGTVSLSITAGGVTLWDQTLDSSNPAKRIGPGVVEYYRVLDLGNMAQQNDVLLTAQLIATADGYPNSPHRPTIICYLWSDTRYVLTQTPASFRPLDARDPAATQDPNCPTPRPVVTDGDSPSSDNCHPSFSAALVGVPGLAGGLRMPGREEVLWATARRAGLWRAGPLLAEAAPFDAVHRDSRQSGRQTFYGWDLPRPGFIPEGAPVSRPRLLAQRETPSRPASTRKLPRDGMRRIGLGAGINTDAETGPEIFGG